MDWKRARLLFTPGVILGAVAVCTLSFVASVAWLIWIAPPAEMITEEIGSGLTLIPGPTSTPPDPTATALPTSTLTPTFTALLPGQMGVGSIVQIVGTDGFGLNIRSFAGLNADINFLGLDAEVFKILDGPIESDGFIWWNLVTPVDKNRSGWAAADFLSLVANP
jgi:hypothetical protein